MGKAYKFSCPVCSYSVKVTGGHDRGFRTEKETMACLDCHTLSDIPLHKLTVMPGEEKWWEGPELPHACPSCGGDNLKPWAAGDSCPSCGAGILQAAAGFELWD